MTARPIHLAAGTIRAVSLAATVLLAGCASSAGASVAPSLAPASPPPSAAAAAVAPSTSGSGYSRGGHTTSPSPVAASGTIEIKTTMTSVGLVLVGPTGLTLYTHAGDTATTSTCTGSCASAWPPLAVSSGQTVKGGTGVTGAFATLARSDGTTQVTYKGMPLYNWQGDSASGDVTGQGIAGFSVAKP